MKTTMVRFRTLIRREHHSADFSGDSTLWRLARNETSAKEIAGRGNKVSFLDYVSKVDGVLMHGQASMGHLPRGA